MLMSVLTVTLVSYMEAIEPAAKKKPGRQRTRVLFFDNTELGSASYLAKQALLPLYYLGLAAMSSATLDQC